jgi:hypothetical protein
MNQAGMALQMFARLDMWQRAEEFKTNFMQHLREGGLKASADNIANAYEVARVVTGQQPAPSKRGTLPVVCPHCGGPVRSDSVDWIDDASAECDFCSGVIQTTDH